MPFVASELVGCSKSDNQTNVNNKESAIISDSSTPAVINSSPTPTPTPVVYDVFCFQAVGLAVSGTQCGNEDTYKIPRGAKITVSAKTSTSVQGGSETNAHYESDRDSEKISIAEMESLATQGANVYVMYYNKRSVEFSKPGIENDVFGFEPAIEVELYDSKTGKFKMFDKDSVKVVFTSGDTQERVEKVGGNLSGTSQSRYRKISSTNKTSSTKLATTSSCHSGKKTFVTAETENFNIYICGDNSPTDYVGVSKKTKESILLPLKSSSQFIAKNGKYTYAVTRQFLTVAENGKIIKKEPIISYQ
jgi:hypothetical protein